MNLVIKYFEYCLWRQMHMASPLPSLCGDLGHSDISEATIICLGWWEVMYNRVEAWYNQITALHSLLYIIPGLQDFSLLWTVDSFYNRAPRIVDQLPWPQSSLLHTTWKSGFDSWCAQAIMKIIFPLSHLSLAFIWSNLISFNPKPHHHWPFPD